MNPAPAGRLVCQAPLVQPHMVGLEQMDFPAHKDLKGLPVYLDLRGHLERKDSEATQGLTGLLGNQERQR